MTDSIVMVTGGAGNLGKAVTRALLAAGGRVVVPFYKTDPLTAFETLRTEFGEHLYTFALDLTTERGAELAVQQAVEWGGRLDAVIHLVGGYTGGQRVDELPIEAWDRMMDLNLKSAWLIARYGIPAMLKSGGGSLVFVSSRAAVRERAGQAAYAVSKSALLTLVEAISDEYRNQGISANAVLPGTIDTEANRRAMPKADHASWTKPEEIARVLMFLASPDARPISGAAIPVYGRS